MIVSKLQKDIDIVSKDFLKDAVVYVPIQDPVSLCSAINDFIVSNEKRIEMSNLINEIKQDFLWSWKDRINLEISLLQELVKVSSSNKK